MRVFVTGGTGFVGSHLVDALLQQDYEVFCLVRSEAKAARIFPERRPQLIVGALADGDAIAEGVRDADYVYHVAGLTAGKNRHELFDVNAEATRRVLSHVKRAAAGLRRFVYVSSLAAAGPSRLGTPLDQSHLPSPVSAYGESKLAGEEIVRASGVPWTIVRPPAVYGPRDAEFLRLVKLARWPMLPLMGDPHQEFSFIYVTDLASALIHALHDAAEDRTYFASHVETVTSENLIGHISRAVRGPGRARPMLVRIPGVVTRLVLASTAAAARLFGQATVLNADKANEFLAEAWTCSPEMLTRDTGWEATVPSTQGWETTVSWYRQHGWL